MIPSTAEQQVTERTVDNFRLLIGLGMIGATEIKAGMHHIPQTTESCIPVRGDRSRKAVEVVDIREEELG